MSLNTLQRVLSSPMESLANAAANYKKECNNVIQMLKGVFSFGLKAVWDEYYNVPGKRDSVSDLEINLNNPDDSWKDQQGKLIKVEFMFEGAKYRCTDSKHFFADDCVEINISADEKQDDVNHQSSIDFFLERINDDGSIGRLGWIAGNIEQLQNRVLYPPLTQEQPDRISHVTIPPRLPGDTMYMGW